jgi:hypothetical protein
MRSRADAVWLAMVAAGLALGIGVFAAWPAQQPAGVRYIRHVERAGAPSGAVLGAQATIASEAPGTKVLRVERPRIDQPRTVVVTPGSGRSVAIVVGD